ncbi:unnamed protein product [Schistosoma mattheei]|uniref:Uncharacterized protein n=1 Tax=Schistosoma mattheei TaxID=31246 RepID=A0A3P8I622_9TREM|nr:unnamed protein product [Schistosoma mattheei]
MNDREQIDTQRVSPRRNSITFSPCGIENTRITVPFSDAVANKLALALNVRHASRPSWAAIDVTF